MFKISWWFYWCVALFVSAEMGTWWGGLEKEITRCEYPRFPITESGAVRSHHFMRHLCVYVNVCAWMHEYKVCVGMCLQYGKEGCFLCNGFLNVTDLAPRGFPWCSQYHWCFNTWKTEFSPKPIRITEQAYVLFILFSFSRFMTYFQTHCNTRCHNTRWGSMFV